MATISSTNMDNLSAMILFYLSSAFARCQQCRYTYQCSNIRHCPSYEEFDHVFRQTLGTTLQPPHQGGYCCGSTRAIKRSRSNYQEQQQQQTEAEADARAPIKVAKLESGIKILGGQTLSSTPEAEREIKLAKLRAEVDFCERSLHWVYVRLIDEQLNS